MVKAVGLVGAGALGQALLHRLILAEVHTKTYDVSATCIRAARDMGSTIAESPAAAAQDVDYVHVCVRTDEQVLEATLGTRGILSGMRRGAVLILHSTVLPETTRTISGEATELGVEVLDASVIGVPAWIREGNVGFLVGGPEHVVELLRPHLLNVGRAVYYFGPLGAGNMAKIAKNLATAVDRVIMVEVLALAEAGGLDPRRVLDMMRVEFHSLTRDWERVFEIEDGHAVAKPATSLLNKDIRHAADLAAGYGLNLPVTRSVAETAAKWVAIWNSNGVVSIEGSTI